MAYSKPPFNNLPFSFSSTGYSVPDFNSIPFKMGLRASYQQTADLQTAINVMGLYQTSTHTYLKECPTIVVGYGVHGVQTLRLPCVYGGVRDLGASLVGFPPHYDLSAYIYANRHVLDMHAYIRATRSAYADLPSPVWSYQMGLPLDLCGRIWPYFNDHKVLPSSLHGWDIRNLSSYLYSIPGINLQAILNIIEIRNLPGTITGEWWHGFASLPAFIPKIFQSPRVDLHAIMHGWDESFLNAFINPMQPRDLPACIFSGVFNSPRDLLAFIASNPIGELNGIIHGWDTLDLSALVGGVYGPTDLRAFLYSLAPNDLCAYIRVCKEVAVPFDLTGVVESYFAANLTANIGLIYPIDLLAYLNAIGKTFDLGASIVPKIILIRRSISVALLEHLDLNALINYMCMSSDSRNLGAYIYSFMKKDLKGSIVGWFGNSADNVIDLSAYINVRGYLVKDLFRPIQWVGLSTRLRHSSLAVRFNTKRTYTVFNTLPIFFGTFYNVNLNAYVNGILTSKNLAATLTPVFDWNYTDLPPWIIPKTHEVVLNIEKMEEQWKRFLEIMFDNTGNSENADKNFVYFYVNGTQKVYRLDRNRHWTIWIKSYLTDPDSMIERKLVRFKYTFNMTKYHTIDEAVRDLIDRVSAYRNIDLTAAIFGELPFNKNLSAYIKVKELRHWLKPLTAFIRGRVHTNYDIPCSISSVLLNDNVDIKAIITCTDYTPPEGDNLIFNFEDDGYIPPLYNVTDLIWTSKDAE